MCHYSNGLILIYLMHQLNKVRVNESFHPDSHRFLALHIDETRFITTCLQMRVLSTLVPLPRSFEEFLPFIETEVLFSQEMEFRGLCRGGELSFADSFSCDESSLEVGREQMRDLNAIIREVAAKAISLQDAMVCEGRVCDAGTEKVSGRKLIMGIGGTN